jgi:cation:H+ antiporter
MFIMSVEISIGLGLAIVAFVIGLILLIKGSDIFVDGAANAALKIGVSEHIIGITLVAFATSLPELAASVVASIEGAGSLAFGNVIGSNIANICLVLGFATMLVKITPSKETLRDVLFMNMVVFLLILVSWDMKIDKIDSMIFFLAFGVYFYRMYSTMRVGSSKKRGPIRKEIIMVVIGLVGVSFGAWLMVEGAIDISESFAVPKAIIGLTIVAIGTSLPELATSVAAALKGKMEISLGNVLGSNIINVLLVLGVAAFIRDIHLSGEETLMRTTFPILIFSSLLMFVYAKHKISRAQALLLLGIYVVFIYLLYLYGIT